MIELSWEEQIFMMEKSLDHDYILHMCKTVEENFKKIKYNIEETAIKCGRNPDDITLLAATKTVNPEIINYLISKGLNYIGENKVQELLDKYNDLNLSSCKVDLIGHLQTNKVKKIIDKVNMIQSVDSIKLAKCISDLSKQHGICMNILIEVNIGKEKNKSGILPEQLDEALDEICKLDNINVKGLMAIPPICKKKEENVEYFDKMHKIFIDINSKKMHNSDIDILSMGMSDSYLQAILCGSTMVRIGSALFGPRGYQV